MKRLITTGAAAALLAATAFAAPAIAQDHGTTGSLARILDDNAPAIVTIRAVMRTEINMGGQSQDNESRTEIQGALVSPSGLVMVSNASLSSDRMNQMMSGMGGPGGGLEINMAPVEMKAVFGSEEKEYEAFVAATDSKLDLAFIQIEGLEGRELRTIDFGNSSTPFIGEELLVVSRLAKGFDYAPYFQTARVSGRLRKPRKALMLDGGIDALGLPVFTMKGEVVGALSTVSSGVKPDAGSGGMRSLMRMMSGGGMDNGAFGTFVLPAGVINARIGQASKKADELLAERAEQRAKAAAEADKAESANKAEGAKPEGDDKTEKKDGAGGF